MIKQISFPEKSILDIRDFNYYDSFQSAFNDIHNIYTIEEICKMFFSTSPRWISYLFNLRNKIVSPLGLKTPDSQYKFEEIVEKINYEPNEKVGIFKIIKKTNNEIILGENDKHLDFKVSLLKEKDTENKKRLTITTVVKYNNCFGRIYFFIVKPFHKVIVKSMLRGIINKTSSN